MIYADSERDYNQEEVFLSGEQVGLIGAMGANFWADVYFLSDGWSIRGTSGQRKSMYVRFSTNFA